MNKELTSRYSLAHLTLLSCSIPELIYIAARAGYDAVSPRLIPMGVDGECPYRPLEKGMVQATRNALKVTGIEVHDVELAAITDNCDVNSFQSAIEAGAELGARRLITSSWTSSSDDRNYIIDTYAEICDLADTYGLSVGFEFPSFSRINNLREAVDIVQAADSFNGGILIDTLYMHLSRVQLSELDHLPSEWFRSIQISDVHPGVPDSHGGMIQIARNARLYPGEGCVDFAGMIERLPPVDYCIEIPNRSRLAELGAEEHARRCLKATKKICEPTKSRRVSGVGGRYKNKSVNTKEEHHDSRAF
ncbi:MAG: sugar phosphate isomerase/epimerase family protein [Arenicella sp.]